MTVRGPVKLRGTELCLGDRIQSNERPPEYGIVIADPVVHRLVIVTESEWRYQQRFNSPLAAHAVHPIDPSDTYDVVDYQHEIKPLSLRDGHVVATVSCSTCHAAKGSRCVYIEPTLGPYTAPSREVLRAGKPTVRQHNARLAAYHHHLRMADRKERRREAQDKRNRENIARLRRVDPIRRAYVGALQSEHEQLVTWLRRYSSVLTEVTR